MKSVLPALVPDLSYDGLEISNGLEASAVLGQLMFASDQWTDAERTRQRDALMEYCRLDTWGMVRLHDRLLEFASPT